MSRFFSRKLRARPQGSIPSPGYLLEWAAFLTILFGIAHIFGLREFTSVLANTIGSTALGWKMSAYFGIVYIFVYLSFVLVVPVLILAALILKLWQKAGATKGASNDARANTAKN